MRKLLLILLSGLLLQAAAPHRVIFMNEDKVMQLIFSSPIKSFKGGFLPGDFAITTEENVLYIQPMGNFPESNMNIITQDGCYYTFTIKYDTDAGLFNYVFLPDEAIYKESRSDNDENTIKNSGVNKGELISLAKNQKLDPRCEKILSKSGYIKSGNMVKVKNTTLSIKGVYADGDNIYIRMELNNYSNIPYELDFIAYSVQTLKRRKATSQEEVQIMPAYTYNLPQTVQPKSKIEFIACFDKFTIGTEKLLSITSLERSGERNLNYELHNALILEAKSYE